MALAKNISVEVLGECETNLYRAWKLESILLAATDDRFDAVDRAFARAARISPSELLPVLPDQWQEIIPWTSLRAYSL